jgi:hypothetical protein
MIFTRLKRIFTLLAVVSCAGCFLIETSFGQSARAKPVDDHIVEQYKAYITDLGSVAAQFAIAQSFFLTMVTALIAFFAFREKRPTRHYFAPQSILIFGLIAAICFIWWLTALEYLNLIGAKFAVLKKMEAAFPALHPMFTQQSESYLGNRGWNYFFGDEGWLRGIVRKQSLLALLIGGAALAMVVIGLVIQFRKRSRKTKDHRRKRRSRTPK